jgi:hypothetical protein
VAAEPAGSLAGTAVAASQTTNALDTPYNHGRPITRRDDSFLSLLRLAGN